MYGYNTLGLFMRLCIMCSCQKTWDDIYDWSLFYKKFEAETK